jgi:hypothetical protein
MVQSNFGLLSFQNHAVALLIAIFLGVCACDSAHLLVQKTYHVQRGFTNRDVPLAFRIFNVGNAAASDVLFDVEEAIRLNEFDVVAGTRKAFWDKIPA